MALSAQAAHFDHNGHPDLKLDDCSAEPDDPNYRAEATRERILRLMDSHEQETGATSMTALKIAAIVGSTVEDVVYHLELLGRDQYVNVESGMKGNHSAWLTASGKQRVREGVKLLGSGTAVSIGAIIGSMTGGTVQAMGSVKDAEISQVVNDPEMLHQALTEMTAKLIDAVKADLPGQALAEYMRTADALVSEVKKPKPDPSKVKRFLGVLSFMGDIEGSVGLMARVQPYIVPLILMANQVLASV